MGVMSRRVLPICGNLCCFCPSLRARSRHPVKRYKKLLADIFPRNQEVELNDRKIGKLCEYASKNSLRIPKITEYLEQRFYKDLRNENVGSAKVVLSVYRKLLCTCREQMPLFACSLLGIIQTLLEQTRQEEMQILGCSGLVDFINIQEESTYMSNMEGLVPKLCQLAQEVGDDDRSLRLRASGLQALSSLVRFMCEQSHIPMEFDKIISATLENFVEVKMSRENGNLDRRASSTNFVNIRRQLETPVDSARNPCYWSKVCLHNMAGLAKEATTVRRVLEPFFLAFDSEDYWSPESGLADNVLMYMQLLLEESGVNSHLLLTILVKHLDHKNVVKRPLKQINIIHVITQLAQNAKTQPSVAITAALSELLKHLRKCMQYSAEASDSESGALKLNSDLHSALEKCILQLSNKIGDAGPLLDIMAVVLENLSNNNIVARTTIFSVDRLAQITSSLPNISYHKKTFPDALFHQLLLAMSHPDHETRISAHRVFSSVLLPSLTCPWSHRKELTSHEKSRCTSVASMKVNSGRFSIPSEIEANGEVMDTIKGDEKVDSVVKPSLISRWSSKSYSFKNAITNGKMEQAALRLSSHQINVLLSSIWAQATHTENTPVTFEALAHTFNIALLFLRSKTSSHLALARCFQLAFSLRSVSLDKEGVLQPSRRRSLYTMASCMVVFSARAGNLPELIPLIKTSLTEATVDPYLALVDNIRLQAVLDSVNGRTYGSEEDNVVALKSLSEITTDENQLKETVLSFLMSRFEKLSGDELSNIKTQFLHGFSPDESYTLGAPFFMETPEPCSPLAELESLPFDEIMPPALLDDALPDANGSQSGRKTSNSSCSSDVLSVNQLLESVSETAAQVAMFPESTTPIPYDQMKDRCEALVACKQQKMSLLQNIEHKPESKALVGVNSNETNNVKVPAMMEEDLEENLSMVAIEPIKIIQGCDELMYPCSLEYEHQCFRLPPASPYDQFLRAAGC